MTTSLCEISYKDPSIIFRAFSGDINSILLESALFNDDFGRYSFIVADPWKTIWTKNGKTFLDDMEIEASFFDFIQQQLLFYKPFFTSSQLLPFQGGMVGYLGYDAGQLLEQLPQPQTDEFNMPDAWLGFYDVGIAFDHHLRKAWIFSTGLPETEENLRSYKASCRLGWISQKLLQHRVFDTSSPTTWVASPVLSETEEEGYVDAVNKVIDYIYAGDIYQANYSRRMRSILPKEVDHYSVYERLRKVNPAPFAAFLRTKWGTLASASPERFLKLRDNAVETKPIKGTKRRSTDPNEDKKIAEELLSSEKDRAENIMIVDLLRNDLSRVCAPLSVKAPKLLALESYATVHHLVTTVVGELERCFTAVDLLKATFPGGSITGAPKIRSMEIITELEKTQRGPFYGSIGYIGFNGTMDTNIVIRTFLIQEQKIVFQVGGGIVADSQPDEEFEESTTKALGLIRALETP